MIREIKNTNIKQEMKTRFKDVFNGIDPFKEIFKDSIQEKLILFPTEGYYLSHKQFEALIRAVEFIGENEIYISEIESENDSFASSQSISESYQCKHWIVKDLIDISEYSKILIVVENAIYSSLGNWGLVISHEEHAVLGGTSEFMKKFKDNYDSWEEDIDEFKKSWEYKKDIHNLNLDWLPILIRHLDRV